MADSDDDHLEYIKSNKGGLKIIHRGYMYTVHKKRQCGGIRWRCAQRSLHCKGSISTGGDLVSPKINMPHSHLPDCQSVELARGRRLEEIPSLSSQIIDLAHHHHNNNNNNNKQAGDDILETMPLQDRLNRLGPPDSTASNNSANPLKSQPLSPTKLKVSRQGNAAGASVATATGNKQQTGRRSPVNEEMCLRWNSHHSNMQTAFPNILSKEQYVDVTLAAEGKTLRCHRLILSSCSPYFEEILSGMSPFQHPVLFMRDIPFWILKSLCDFMYAGEVHICQDKLEELLLVAEALKIKGLAGKSDSSSNANKSKTPEKTLQDPAKDHQKHQQQSQDSFNQQQKFVGSATNVNSTRRGKYEVEEPDDDEEELLDPLDLLEPMYEEISPTLAPNEKKVIVAPPPVNIRPQFNSPRPAISGTTRNFPARRPRKRRYNYYEPREESPPPVFTFRKGTRSRPNIKVPKYYHITKYNKNEDFDDPAPSPSTSAAAKPIRLLPPPPTPIVEPSPDLDLQMSIKTEPVDEADEIDVVDNNLGEYEEGGGASQDGGIRGGLEVIKLAVQQPQQPKETTEAVTNECAPDITTTRYDENHVVNEDETVEHHPPSLTVVTTLVDDGGVALATTEEEEEEAEKVTNEEATIEERVTSLGYLEKEAMNVVNVISMEIEELDKPTNDLDEGGGGDPPQEEVTETSDNVTDDLINQPLTDDRN